MADTYKHKLAYQAKHFHWSHNEMPVREDPWKSFPWHKVPRNDHMKVWAKKYLQHSFRQQIRKKMQNEEYDLLPFRPTRFAWIID